MDIEREIKDLEKISLNKSRNMDEREAAAIKLMRLRAKHNTKKNRKNNAHNTKHNKNTKHNTKHNTKRSRKWNVPNTDSYKSQRGLH